MTEKAAWQIADGEFHERWLKRLKNGSWILVIEDMTPSGAWKREIEYIEPSEAARLLMDATCFDMEGTGLEEYGVDDKEVTV
tara:strand:+ start:90 stop:335 length:246 start_codon:yes stop_codon:yes gene_type:complete